MTVKLSLETLAYNLDEGMLFQSFYNDNQVFKVVSLGDGGDLIVSQVYQYTIPDMCWKEVSKPPTRFDAYCRVFIVKEPPEVQANGSREEQPGQSAAVE